MNPIPLVVLDAADKPTWEDRRAGMCWRYPPGDEAGREAWWIVLPMTHPDVGTPGHPSTLSWITTDRASAAPHAMWDIAGTMPNITVSPSIDVLRFVKRVDPATGKPTWVREGSYWHGWIRDGKLVDA